MESNERKEMTVFLVTRADARNFVEAAVEAAPEEFFHPTTVDAATAALWEEGKIRESKGHTHAQLAQRADELLELHSR